MKPPPETVVALLERAATFEQKGLRLLDRKEEATWRSWRELHEASRKVAGGLQAAGITRGERVALVYPTREEFFLAFFGILLAGAVPVPLYPPVRLGRLQEYLARTAAQVAASGARLLLADSVSRRVLGEVVEKASCELGCLRLGDLPAREHSPADIAPGDLALVQFSSGTTVSPKPVALSHRALLAQAAILNSLWPDTPEITQSGVSWLPLYHDMGLIGCVLPALERPGDLTLLPPEVFVHRPAVWLRAISRYRATISPAPNFAYGLCLQKIRDEELEGVDLSSWRVALNGAEAVNARVLEAFVERFGRWGFRRQAMTPVYGLSEAALAVTFSDLGSHFRTAVFDREDLATRGRATLSPEGRSLVSVGRPLPGFELRIRDPDASVLPAGRVGHVEIRGPSLMEGYLGRERATAEVFREGWLDTGDLGFLHDGELFLAGRSKDVLIVRGRNHAPEEIEHPLDAVPGLRRGCSVAVAESADEGRGERLILLAEASRDLEGTAYGDLAAACQERVLETCGLELDEIAVLPAGSLPRTSSGKLRRQEALRRYRAGELAPGSRVTAFFLAKAVLGSALAYRRHRARKGARR